MPPSVSQIRQDLDQQVGIFDSNRIQVVSSGGLLVPPSNSQTIDNQKTVNISQISGIDHENYTIDKTISGI